MAAILVIDYFLHFLIFHQLCTKIDPYWTLEQRAPHVVYNKAVSAQT